MTGFGGLGMGDMGSAAPVGAKPRLGGPPTAQIFRGRGVHVLFCIFAEYSALAVSQLLSSVYYFFVVIKIKSTPRRVSAAPPIFTNISSNFSSIPPPESMCAPYPVQGIHKAEDLYAIKL